LVHAVCSLETQPGEHEPVTLYAIPSADELGEAMYAIARSGARRGQGDDRRFRNSIKGWAKLAHQVLTGDQR
jgi:hypothetical protein